MKKFISLFILLAVCLVSFCGCGFENSPRVTFDADDERALSGWVDDYNNMVTDSMRIGNYTVTDKDGKIVISDGKNTYNLDYYSDGIVIGTLENGNFIDKYQSSRAMLSMLSGFSGHIENVDKCIEAVNIQIDDLLNTITNCRNEFDASMDEAGVDVDGYIGNLSDLVNDYIEYRDTVLKPQLEEK